MTGQTFHQHVKPAPGLVDAMAHCIQFTTGLHELGTQLLVFCSQRLHQLSEFMHLAGELVEIFEHAAIVTPGFGLDPRVCDGARGNS